MPDRREEHAEFAVAPVGPKRGGRQLAAVVVIAALAIGAVVAKPWSSLPEARTAFGPLPTASVEPATSAATDAPASMLNDPPPLTPEPSRRPPPWVLKNFPGPRHLVSVLTSPDAWGIRLVTVDEDGVPAEVWREARLFRAGFEPPGTPSSWATMDVEHQVALVGITAPAGASPPGLELLGTRPLGRLSEIATRAVRVPVGDDPVELFARLDGQPWAAGTYQLWLTGDGTRQVLRLRIAVAAPA